MIVSVVAPSVVFPFIRFAHWHSLRINATNLIVSTPDAASSDATSLCTDAAESLLSVVKIRKMAQGHLKVRCKRKSACPGNRFDRASRVALNHFRILRLPNPASRLTSELGATTLECFSTCEHGARPVPGCPESRSVVNGVRLAMQEA